MKVVILRNFVTITMIFMVMAVTYAADAIPKRLMENLDRGVVAMHRADGKVYVGWRLLGTDPEDIAFNLYRSEAGGTTERIAEKRTKTTDFVDENANMARDNSYFVRPVINNKEGNRSSSFTLKANAPKQAYLAIPLKREPGDKPLRQFATTVGDLDGDGEYEYVVRWSANRYVDPGKTFRTPPSIDSYKLEAYELDGTRLWRIDLGVNVPTGVDFSQTVVHDLDGDGKAEIITKTSEGTVAGDGMKIGDTDGDGVTIYGNLREESPEFFSIFSGESGKEIARGDWIPRGELADWGDDYGNRANRHHMAVAYLDGVQPSLVIMRGDYGMMVMEAWNFRDGKLKRLWTWSNKDKPEWYYKGSHMVRVVDVNGDGRDEIMRGALTLGPDGKVLYAKDEGHGDEFRVGDLDPDRPGLEVWMGYERAGYPKGVQLYDATTGECIWGFKNHIDMGKSQAAPLDPNFKGYHLWSVNVGLYDKNGKKLTSKEPKGRYEVWWDADLCRELLSVRSRRIDKYDIATHTQSTLQKLGAYVGVSGVDALGDWREEIFGLANNELRIYTTTISASNRLYTLMHDPAYRLGVANLLQRKSPTSHPSFYLGPKMSPPPRPHITTQKESLKD